MPLRRMILVPEPVTNAFGRRAFAGIVSAAYELGDVQLALRSDSSQPWPDAIRECGADGAIVRPTWKHEIAPIAATGIPLVSFLNYPALQQHMPLVTNDDAMIGRLAAEHLLEMGHRHFATFTAAELRTFFKPRIDAFNATIQAAGYEVTHGPDVMDPSIDPDEPLPADYPRWDLKALEWLLAQPRPLAIFAPYDYYAYEATNLCGRAGLSIPSDAAIVGVDDDDIYCPVTRPPLSSVATAAYEIGRQSLMTLHRMLNGKAPLSRVTHVPPKGLIIRGSSSLEAVGDAEVQQAVRYIREHLARPLSVDDIVRHVMISRRSLERRFMTRLNRTISEQIRHVRVEHAKRLLVDTDLLLNDVAKRSGLAPQQRLQTVFKSLTGQTPGGYRLRFQQSQ